MAYDDDDLGDRDDPQPEDIEALNRDDDDDDEDDYRRCSACGHGIYRGAPQCPRCGEWFTEPAVPCARIPGWLWTAVVALLIAIILVMWHGLGR